VARELRAFSATVPAGTPQSAPVTFDMSFPTRIVDNIAVFIPPGANGVVGFAIANAGIPIIPYNQPAFLVGNGEVVPIPLTDQITSGSWQLVAYNAGQYPHTLYVRFYLSLVVAGGTTMVELPSLSDLSSGFGDGGAGGVEAPIVGEVAPTPTTGPLILTNPPPTGPAPPAPVLPPSFGGG
jgi:hypothetical protein